jgi:hypothetical protein
VETRRAKVLAAAAKLDAFLASAIEEFGHNARDAAGVSRRIDAYFGTKSQPPNATAMPSRTVNRTAA